MLDENLLSGEGLGTSLDTAAEELNDSPDNSVNRCPCGPCPPRYEELIKWADHLERVAARLEGDDEYYLDAVADIIINGWQSEFAQVGIHDFRDPNPPSAGQAAIGQWLEHEIPEDFFREDLSTFFYGFGGWPSLNQSVNDNARSDIVAQFRKKADNAREVAQTGIDYAEGNPSYMGRDAHEVIDYFCTRDPEMITWNVWNTLLNTGLIDYATWEDVNHAALADFEFRAAVASAGVALIFATRHVAHRFLRSGVTSAMRMVPRQLKALRFLAQRKLATVPFRRTVRVYRVEGGGNAFLEITKNGNVVFIRNDGRMFHLNGGIRSRALAFQQQRAAGGFPDNAVKSFRIPRSFIRELDETAITQSEMAAIRASGDPGRIAAAQRLPQVVDGTRAPLQFGLRQEQIDALKAVLVQGSGRIE